MPTLQTPILRRVLSVLFVAAVALASCREATAVRVHVYTDVPWNAGRRLLISAGTAPTSSEPSGEVKGPWGTTDLGDLVFLPGDDKSGAIRILVVMGVTKDPRSCSIDAPDGCIFARRKLSFVPYRTLTLPMSVRSACIGIACSDDTTCNALGQCVSAEVRPEDCASPGGCSDETPPSAFIGADAGEGPPDGPPDAGEGPADADVPDGSAPTDERLLSSRGSYTCATLTSGDLKCWGANDVGQLGLGDTNHRGDQAGEMGDALPFVNLGTGRTAKMISAGVFHTCAVLDNDTVKCWGSNSYGELGLGDKNDRGDQAGEMGDNMP